MNGISSNTASAASQATAGFGDKMAVSVIKMQQDQQKADGQAAVSLMESAARVQGNEPGKGGRVDVTG